VHVIPLWRRGIIHIPLLFRNPAIAYTDEGETGFMFNIYHQKQMLYVVQNKKPLMHIFAEKGFYTLSLRDINRNPGSNRAGFYVIGGPA
jgi:hypothetical protein